MILETADHPRGERGLHLPNACLPVYFDAKYHLTASERLAAFDTSPHGSHTCGSDAEEPTIRTRART